MVDRVLLVPDGTGERLEKRGSLTFRADDGEVIKIIQKIENE